MIRRTAAGTRRRAAVPICLLAVLVAGCGGGGSEHHAVTPGHLPALTSSAPSLQPDGAAPPVKNGVLVVPNGPVRLLLKHLLPGAQAITAVDLKSVRGQLGLRADAVPFAPTSAQQPGAASLLAALTALVVPPRAGSSLLSGIDFGSVRAIVEYSGSGHRGLLLATQASRASLGRQLNRAGWHHLPSGFRLRPQLATGILRTARLRLMPGGVVLMARARDAAASARQRAIPADDRHLVSLLGSYPSPATFATVAGPGSCVASVVAQEQLTPHDAAESITVRGRPQLSRVLLTPRALGRAGLRALAPTVRGSLITVPIVPRAGAAGSLGALVGALENIPAYRC